MNEVLCRSSSIKYLISTQFSISLYILYIISFQHCLYYLSSYLYLYLLLQANQSIVLTCVTSLLLTRDCSGRMRWRKEIPSWEYLKFMQKRYSMIKEILRSKYFCITKKCTITWAISWVSIIWVHGVAFIKRVEWMHNRYIQ